MGNTVHFFQTQDSLPKTNTIVSPVQNSGLKIQRNTIDLGSLREIENESVRVVPVAKPKPIVKTIPFIPLNDSIQHPYFDVLTTKFIFKEELSFFDEMAISPFDPELKNEVYTPKAKKAIELTKPEKTFEVKESIKKENLLSTSSDKSVGFLNTDWMLGVIIFSLILFGWMRVGYNRFFHSAIQASYNYFAARRIFEEGNVTRSRVFYFMNLLFFVNISLFLAQYLEYKHISIFKMEGLLLFAICFVAFVILYTLKATVFYVLDFIFVSKGAFPSYVFTIFLYNKMIGFLLLPIVSVLPFVPPHVTPWLFLAGAVIVIFLYVFRVFKGIQLCFKNRLSIFYLFLYLCALEILPILTLIKIASAYF